ncbi:MAG: FKBP-type peptidyl-prolyl cis-trans isomerase [Patescibacteria group bacterium]
MQFIILILVGLLGGLFLLNAPTQTVTTGSTQSEQRMQEDNQTTQDTTQSGKTVKLPNGLEYTDTVEGTGDTVQTGDYISIHYVGTLEDGTKFDSSVDRNQPFETYIGVGQVIQGWDQGVVGMKVGGERTLVIPSNLAYGDSGIPGAIPPKATLIFKVKLLGIRK